MRVLLTGGTGFIGSAVLEQLLSGGHQVTALVRSQSAADAVVAAGADALRGEITDIAWLTERLAGVDGAIHTASPGDAGSADVDRAVATAAADAFAQSGKPYVHTSGIWVFGSGSEITEETPWDAPAITAWRAGVEELVRAGEGFRNVIVGPGVVYGGGQGLPNVLKSGPHTADGALALIGDGTQHWATVHADDLAQLYLLALEHGVAGEYYIGAGGENPTVAELGLAISPEAGGPGVTPETVEETRARLGDAFTDALLLDQQATGAKAREELGWKPAGLSLVDELASGSYA